jgi:L-lactate dehydrogenase complex protein LldF
MIKNNLSHSDAATIFNEDEKRVDWHDETLWFVREKRDKAAHQIPEWELLRETASQIKNNVLSNIHQYLQEFETNALKNGIIIHWATDGNEHNKIVHSIIAKHGVKQMVKSKSMLTEECHLNEYLSK